VPAGGAAIRRAVQQVRPRGVPEGGRGQVPGDGRRPRRVGHAHVHPVPQQGEGGPDPGRGHRGRRVQGEAAVRGGLRGVRRGLRRARPDGPRHVHHEEPVRGPERLGRPSAVGAHRRPRPLGVGLRPAADPVAHFHAVCQSAFNQSELARLRSPAFSQYASVVGEFLWGKNNKNAVWDVPV